VTDAPICLLAGNPGPMTGRGTNTWLLDGDEPTLVDAGVGEASHVRAVADHLGGRPLARLLLTHNQPDHASGLAALRHVWPDLDACKWPMPGESGWRRLDDGAVVRAGGRDLVVIHTPGHAPDHVCFYHAPTGDLFGGDMVIDGTTVMIPAGHGGSLRAYMRSLERLAELRPARIFPGHGTVIDQPLRLIETYLRHRREREAEVIACVEEGLSDADSIVSRLYPGLSDAVRPAARLTIQAHLDKIAEDRQS
jgi:glyoxylase-like metal-dependent hydrolase (beta-lactamase superfamily II)